MASMYFMQITNEDLQQYLNTGLSLAAQEMVKDGLIANAEQVTERYLAMVVEKGKVAKMFDRWFKAEDKSGTTKFVVVRVDSTVKEDKQ